MLYSCHRVTSAWGPLGRPGACCLPPAAKAGLRSALAVLPHRPGCADVFSLGGRSDFSTCSVSQFILSTLILGFDHSPPQPLAQLFPGRIPVLAKRALFPLKPEVRTSSLRSYPAPLQQAHGIRPRPARRQRPGRPPKPTGPSRAI